MDGEPQDESTEPEAGHTGSRTEDGGSGLKSARALRIRGWVAATLVVFAVLFAIATAVAAWSHSLLLDTDKYVKTVAPMLKDRQVTAAIGQVVAHRTVDLVDRAFGMEAADPGGSGSGDSAGDELRAELAREVTDVLRTEEAYGAWEAMLRYSHRRVVDTLRDRDPAFTIEGEALRVDLVPFIVAALRELEKIAPSLLGADDPIPTLAADATPQEQREALGAYLGMTLSTDFAKVTLFESDKVALAKQGVALFDRLVEFLYIFTGVLAAAALVVSPRRLRTLIQLGIGAVIVVLVAVLTIDQIKSSIVAGIGGESGPIITGALDRVLDGLRNAVVWLLVAGAAVGVSAYVLIRVFRPGKASETAATGAAISTAATEAATGTTAIGTTGMEAPTGTTAGALVAGVRRYADPLRAALGVIVVVLVLFVPLSFGGSLALVGVAAAVILGVTWVVRGPPPAAEHPTT